MNFTEIINFLLIDAAKENLFEADKKKKDLVESILLQYPIPLILLASQTDKYEIIDEMQR